MGGKSLNYRPVGPPEELEGAEPEEEEDESLPGSSEGGDNPGLAMLGLDRALENAEDAGSQPAIGDMVSQRPTWDKEKDEANNAEAEAERLFPESHVLKREDIPKAVMFGNKRVHCTELQWDTNCSLGQVRVLNNRTVEHYVARLKSRPPRRPIRILVRATAGM